MWLPLSVAAIGVVLMVGGVFTVQREGAARDDVPTMTDSITALGIYLMLFGATLIVIAMFMSYLTA